MIRIYELDERIADDCLPKREYRPRPNLESKPLPDFSRQRQEYHLYDSQTPVNEERIAP